MAQQQQQNMLDELISTLKQERDELRVKMHLASMDAKDEYDRLSEKCDQLMDEADPLKDAVEETAENVFTALGMVAGELKVGFQRVRKAISEEE